MPPRDSRTKTAPRKRPKYDNPPIHEALCDIKFESAEPFDATSLLLRLHTELSDDYPGPTKTQTVQAFTLAGEGANIREQLARIQVLGKDPNRLISVGPNALSINVLRPYPGWDEDFRPRIERAFAALQQTVSPKHVTRIGLRYINRISVPDPEAKASDYFTNVDRNYPDLDCTLGPFFKRLEYLTSSGEKIIVTQATLVPKASTTADFLLDIDVVCDRAPIVLGQVLQLASDLHERVSAVFESLITEKSRRLFDAH